MLALRMEYAGILLSFRLGRKEVSGILKGSRGDWTFESQSPAFLRQVPSGRLSKYALWLNNVPSHISDIYEGIRNAALNAGYEMDDSDD